MSDKPKTCGFCTKPCGNAHCVTRQKKPLEKPVLDSQPINKKILEGKLMCPNPREEAIKKGIPCIMCGYFMVLEGCANMHCDAYAFEGEKDD